MGKNEPGVRVAIEMGVVATVAIGLGIVILLVSGSVRAIDLLVAGGLAPTAAVIEEDFGVGSLDPEASGNDGQGFYVVAREFPDLQTAAQYTDAPRYRMMRIVTPAIASLGGEGPAVVYILTALSVVGAGLAVGGLADLANVTGRPPAVGFLAIPPLIFGIYGSLADPLAVGLFLVGLAFAHRRHHWAAVGMMTAAALTREQLAALAIVCAIGLVFDGVRAPRRLVPYLIPGLAVGAWYLALGQIVGGSSPDRFDVLAILRSGTEGMVLGFIALALSLGGAWTWRETPEVSLVTLVSGLWVLVYFAGTFELGILAVPRVTATSIALGSAGLVSLAFRSRPVLPEPVVSGSHEAP